MAEYIERQKVIDITAETGALETQRRIKELPASDVAEMVRCKDCKFCDDAYCNDGRKLKDLYYCNWFGSVVEKNDFCSYGKRKQLEE